MLSDVVMEYPKLDFVLVYCGDFEQGLLVPKEVPPHSRYHYIFVNGKVKKLGQKERPLCC